MDFRIADTFTDSLARLTADEQKAVKTTAFDLQIDPSSPGMSFHKLDRAKDRNFWSVRVNRDLRLIVHRTPGSLLLCYVDHHDKAYDWAERRKLETHPATGAAQLVEIRERVQEIVVPVFVEEKRAARPKPPLFANIPDATLLGYGVPAEWLGDVRAATEDTLLEISEHLPQEAAEALLDLATGSTPRRVEGKPAVDPFEHPDAQRRFRVVQGVEELERALEYPWDKWTIFLHPSQREIVERPFNGPARVSGSAGTGKTIVALHRAVHLARANSDSRVLLTTFTENLANALRTRLRRLIGDEPRLGERIDIGSLDVVARRLYERNVGRLVIAPRSAVRDLLVASARESGNENYAPSFLASEWEDVVDAWQLDTWEAYRDVPRLGRKTRLPEKQRKELWAIFDRVRSELAKQGLTPPGQMYERLSAHFAASKRRPFDFVIVDESQDLNVPELRFLATLGASEPNRLFFAGDLGQRIFQQPFSWKSLGVDIRGRSSTLRINYRTSHQIRAQADRLLGSEISDVDGNEERRSAISVFNGPRPAIQTFADEAGEIAAVAAWLKARIADGVAPGEVAVFVRSDAELPRAKAAMSAAAIPFKVLDESVQTSSDRATICTMHVAKGLEFRSVAVMACDDEVVPLQSRIESVTDASDLEEVYNTERHLLYVACTRARDHLLVTAVAPGSEFLADLRENPIAVRAE